jgi:hypothetical protein
MAAIGTARRRAISFVPHDAKVVAFLLQSLLSHSSTPKMGEQCVLGRASMEALAKDTDDAETKDNRWCMTSYVLYKNLVSQVSLNSNFAKKKSAHKYPRYCSITDALACTKDPRYFTKKLPLSLVQNLTV